MHSPVALRVAIGEQPRLQSSGSYFPPPAKAVPIPKKSAGVRILGIPTVAERIAQTAVKIWLEPRLDPIFRDDSYGYRPGKSALAAIAVTRRCGWDYDWVVEFDVRGLFDNLEHDLLMKALRKHCQEPRRAQNRPGPSVPRSSIRFW
jgi:RNA-directed DNA polymerase